MPVTCGEGPGCTGKSLVKTKRMGKRKFRNGKVGRQKAAITYKRAHRKRITTVLKRAWDRKRQAVARQAPSTARLAAARAMPRTRAQVWANFKRHDNCGWRPNSGTGTWATWTCRTSIPKIENQLTKREIKGLVCFGAGGLAVPAVVISGGTAAVAWGLIGIGAGASACTWGDMLAARGR